MISDKMKEFNKITVSGGDSDSDDHNQFSIHNEQVSNSYGGFEDDEDDYTSMKEESKKEKGLPSEKKNQFQEERDRIDREMAEKQKKREQEKAASSLIQQKSVKQQQSIKPAKEEEKVDPYKHFQAKLGFKVDSHEDEEIEVSQEFQIQDTHKEQTDAFESSKESAQEFKINQGDFDHDFEFYEESQESKKEVFEVNENDNVFKQKAMMQSNVREMKTDSPKEIEIKMGSSLKPQSEVGFDESIEDHFSEEPIDDDFQEELPSKGDQGAAINFQEGGGTVMMGSVVPNPKIVPQYSLGSTVIQQETTVKRQITKKKASMEEIEEDGWGQDEEEVNPPAIVMQENSFDKLEEVIQKIEPQWSPKDSKVPRQDKSSHKATKASQEAKTQQKATTVQKRTQSKEKQAQGRIRPQTAKVIKQSQKDPQKNQDLKDVMNKSKSPQREPAKARAPSQNKSKKEEEKKEEKPSGVKAENQKPPLLNPKQKSSRVILGQTRPESAKPKVGYQPTTTLGGKKSSNMNDLSAMLAQNKKFQMIKQLKEEKEKKKEVIVRDLKKAKVVKEKGKAEKKALNEDLLFEEEEVGAGDQGAAPMGPVGKAEQQIEKELEKEFQAKKTDKRETVKDLAKQKEEGFVGNALGSGQFQKKNEEIKRENVNMALQPSRAPPKIDPVVAKKEGQFTNNNVSQKPKNMQRVEDEKKEREAQQKAEKEAESRVKFQQILKDKKEKSVNKDVLGFMMVKQQMDKDIKKVEFEANVNKQAANFEVKTTQGLPPKKSDKVSEHAKLVLDNEGQTKEVADLKRKLKELNFENKKVQANVLAAEREKRAKEAQLDKLVKEKDLVVSNGKYVVRTAKAAEKPFRIEDIPDYDKLTQERVNPLEPVVKKIELRGYTLEQAFTLLDDDCNEVLTLQEINTGLGNLGVELSNEEYKEMVKQIDANNDGVLTLQEFLHTLQPRYEAQKEVREVMQGLNFEDPIDLEERILDLRFRSRKMQEDIKILKKTAGPNSKYKKNPQEGQLGDKIKNLELKLSDKVQNAMKAKLEYDQKIQDSMTAKEQVYSQFNKTKEERENRLQDYQKNYGSLSTTVYALEGRLNDDSSKLMAYRTKKEDVAQLVNRQRMKMEQMGKLEARLDEQLEEILGRAVNGKDPQFLAELDLKILIDLNTDENKRFDKYVTHFSAVTIQRLWKGHNSRHNYAIMKFQMKRLARKLQPLIKEKYQNKKVAAATLISRCFRRYRERKAHLKRLQLQNELKRLKEEEEEEYMRNEEKKKKAARTILKNWRNFKGRKRLDFTFVLRTATVKEFGNAETIYLPVVRKCIICKVQNALRFCKGCNDGVYCLNCFNEYHFRGHRKMHVWLRIVYSAQEAELRKVQKQWIDEKEQPSTIIVEDKVEVIEDKVEEIREEGGIAVATPKKGSHKKSVSLDDNAFLKSIQHMMEKSGINLKDVVIREAETRNLNIRRIKFITLQDIIGETERLGMSMDERRRFAQIMQSRLVPASTDLEQFEVDVLEINSIWKER